MYLQKLEIQGFKSFAKKTVLEFPKNSYAEPKAHSITAIVGPNGSGKSNISDAIRWVLGEQSVKLLRGKKTEDVIFAGSESRARMGFAEVSLYLNNEDKSAPIDYSEIVITRRVFRDGEGEYLINKNKVRLFDILMLLAKANFGQKSYSIISQGMIDHVMNLTPYERKEFFDEATGVKQYQIKRDQAINKLNRSRENLEQSNRILTELEPRLRLLTRQIKKLEKRQEIEKELRTLQQKYYAQVWQTLKADKIKYEEMLNLKEALKSELDARLADIQTRLAAIAREESRKEIFNNLQKDFNKLTSEKNEILKELSVLKGKASLEYFKIGKQNLKWLEDKKEELERRLDEIKESLNNLSMRKDYQKELLLSKEQKLESLTNEIFVLQNNLRSTENDLESLKSSNNGIGEVQASIRAILSLRNKNPNIYGVLKDLGKTEELYETALAVAAGGQLNAIVVKDDETAVECIKYLKENRLGPVTFLPLNKLKVSGIKDSSRKLLVDTGAIGFAVELLSFDPKYKKAFQFVFGSTIVVDTTEHAKKIGIGSERLVTLDGDIFEKTGLIKGGWRKKSLFGWFNRGEDKKIATQEEKMREITVLKSQLETLLRQKDILFNEINTLKVELQVNETKEKGLKNDLESLQKEKNKIVAEINQNQIAPQDQEKFLKEINLQKAKAEEILKKIDINIAAVRKKIDEFNLNEEKKKVEVFNLQDEMQIYQTKLNAVLVELNDVKINLAKIETKRENLEKEVVQELGPDVKLDDLCVDGVFNLEQLWFEIGKSKKSLELIGGIDPEIVDEHKEVSERYEFLLKETKDLEAAIVDLEKIISELDAVIERQFNSSFKKINRSFEHYFKRIFQGGHAKLTLVQKEEEMVNKQMKLRDENGQLMVPEEQEGLKAKVAYTPMGIDIYVSPPNKKLTTIAALSGGERTMTSLALLCAIIDNNPSPFVVLDEVEAALDEVNSERFAAILRELSLKSQFIVITHNRVIMHVADILYGVAMGEDGVSKILSLDLKEAEKIGE